MKNWVQRTRRTLYRLELVVYWLRINMLHARFKNIFGGLFIKKDNEGLSSQRSEIREIFISHKLNTLDLADVGCGKNGKFRSPVSQLTGSSFADLSA